MHKTDDSKRRKPTPRYPVSIPVQTQSIARPTLVTPTFLRIAFVGKICSGKTTLAKHVQRVAKQHQINVERAAFGDFVKQMASDYFCYDEQKHKNRDLLVQLGTSMRNIHVDVWVNCLRKKIEGSDVKHWVVDDVRHKNEFHMLQELGFTIMRIDIDKKVQRERILKTYPDTFDEHFAVESHSTEQEMLQGDITFDKILPTETSKHDIEQWINGVFNTKPTHMDIGGECAQ